MLSNIINPQESVLNLLTDILVKTEVAEPHLVLKILSVLLDIKMFQESLLLPKPFKEDQSPSELMPQAGNLTLVVSSPTVEHPSITESYSLVILQAIG